MQATEPKYYSAEEYLKLEEAAEFKSEYRQRKIIPMVVNTPLVYAEGRGDTITNPLIITEVLSNYIESYDRGKKFEYYRSMSSFQEYILIDQYRNHVEQFTKTEEGKWLFSECGDVEDILYLSAVECEISLEDIYQVVEFDLE